MNMNIKIRKFGLLLTIFFSIIFIKFASGDESFLGEKYLAYLESLPKSFAVISWQITPISEKNINFFSKIDRNIYPPSIYIYLHVNTPQKRLIEKIGRSYDISISRDLYWSIEIGDQEKSSFYIPTVNTLKISSPSGFYNDRMIMAIINPLAFFERSPEGKSFLKNNYVTEGSMIKFPVNWKKDNLNHIFVMSDESALCPPIERINMSQEGKIRSKFSITSKEYHCGDGSSFIFPHKLEKSWGENFEDKGYFEVIHFDVLNNEIIDDLFSLEIPDGALIKDERLEILYHKNSDKHDYSGGSMKTKFSLFGLSYEQVLEMIDNKIKEDRQKHAQNIK